MSTEIKDESEVVKEKFISTLGKMDNVVEITHEEIDVRKENLIFYLFIGFMVILIIASAVAISLSDPFYKRMSGSPLEFLLTFCYHTIIICGIMKSVRPDESVSKHIFAGSASVLLFGTINILSRLLFAGSKPFIWVIMPLLAKFTMIDSINPLYSAAAFIVPVAFQIGLLMLLYRRDRVSLLAPYLTYFITSNTITAFLMMTPLVGGV